jgi:uncharacterized protein DUF6677
MGKSAIPQTVERNPRRASEPPIHREYAPLAGFLSYLIPGLGQISQGRIGKGLLFFVCITGLFFYGMYLGNWSNVYLPDLADENKPLGKAPLLANLYHRPQFLGQVWVGVAAWPAIVQYMAYDKYAESGPLFGIYQRFPYENRSSDEPPADMAGDPAGRRKYRKERDLKASEALKDWPGKTLNEMQTEGDKTWDLGWVFTVIAGVLNIMVIYDALAGPAFIVTEPEESKE